MGKYLVLLALGVFASVTVNQVCGNQLCNADEIGKELAKAIKLLKLKQEQVKNNPTVSRQDDDDDLPFYVPAIAKVIGAVLAQNVSSVIEESFGFIPPEANENVQVVLGLIADTVSKLRPTVAPQTTPSPPMNLEQNNNTPANNISETEAIAEIEALLSYALAQSLNETIFNNNTYLASSESTPASVAFKEVVITQEIPTEDSTTKSSEEKFTTAPMLFSSTFNYSSSQQDAISLVDIPIYAPAYAPNYVPTTKSPMYAPAFDYNRYTTPASSNSILGNGTTTQGSIISATIDDNDTEVSTEATLSTTTEDEDDEYEET